ncbi:hypothetical protein B7494_g3913 [Chlorociboria aeruginascens]|nr:hypothetical protein B7494_g3913 [Chlorociboria aeruginascens]
MEGDMSIDKKEPIRDGSDDSMDSTPEAEAGIPQDSNPGQQKRKGGRKPIYATSEERKQRNRQAQAAFRERRTEYIKQLEETIRVHETNLHNLQTAHRSAADECLMLRYKNSLLERILLEKGIDVQAELRAKTGSPHLGPTHMPQNMAQAPTVQRAIMNRHHQARRSNSNIAPKMEPGISLQNNLSPQSRPTPPSHASSPTSNSPGFTQPGVMTPPGSDSQIQHKQRLQPAKLPAHHGLSPSAEILPNIGAIGNTIDSVSTEQEYDAQADMVDDQDPSESSGPGPYPEHLSGPHQHQMNQHTLGQAQMARQPQTQGFQMGSTPQGFNSMPQLLDPYDPMLDMDQPPQEALDRKMSSDTIVSKNLYELLGNTHDEDSDKEPEPPVKVVDKTPARTTKRNAPAEAPSRGHVVADGRGSRRGGLNGNEGAFRDRNAGSAANRGKPTEDGHQDRRQQGAYDGRGGRGNRGGRQFDRHSRAVGGESEKQAGHGWGANEGGAELADEQAGETIAKADQKEALTGDGEATPIDATAAATEPAVEAEPEDNSISYADYLAQQAEKKLALGSGVPEARKPNEGSKEDKKWAKAKPITKEEEEEFITGSQGKAKRERERKPKQVVEIDHGFVEAPEQRGGRGGFRGGRGRGSDGSSRGSRGGESRGGRGDGGRGRGRGDNSRGGPRSLPRGGAGAASINTDDPNAFPSLGS